MLSKLKRALKRAKERYMGLSKPKKARILLQALVVVLLFSFSFVMVDGLEVIGLFVFLLIVVYALLPDFWFN